MQKRAKNEIFRARNEVFGHFLEIGASVGLDIAYFDSAKWSSRFGIGITGVVHH